ncbi:MAG TPA: GspE/PulE family protein [Tepidisphaeraceae bacterium]|jgi:type II secretory ATPase GspE/PulE/Tfp pilus assembly ATPase PilB-like protein
MPKTAPIASPSTATEAEAEGGPPKFPSLAGLGAEEAVGRVAAFAVQSRCSDLFLASEADHLKISVRQLGTVREVARVPVDLGRRFISHLKATAGMDLTERRRPLDGRWIFDGRESGNAVEMRINIVPTLHGEDMAIRMLDRESQLYDLTHLGLEPEQHDQVLSMLDSPGGLILLAGPTGSGKTATIYACVQHLNDGNHKINTIEDPIEFALPGVRQSQVNLAIKLGFHDLLRAILRQSPDVIVVGEIRDRETAQTAVHAANAGHLVLATVHASSAAAGPQSLRALDVHTPFLASSLRGVISQRLVRTLCPNCKTPFDVADVPHVFDEVKRWLKPGEGKTLYAPRGCEICEGRGYTARTGVFEVMPISAPLRNAIADAGPAADLRRIAIDQGLPQFRQAALLKVAKGQTSTDEVFRAIPSEQLGELDE